MSSLENGMEKLTADTYHQWKFEMKMLLMGKNLWEIVDGFEVLHGFATDGEVLKFKKRQNHALSTICLNVSRDLHIYVRNAKSAKEAWDNLANRFEEKFITRKLELRRKLYDAKLKGGSMIQHVNNIKTIAEQLENLDDNQCEKDLVFILMSSVPMDKYRNLIATLETVDECRLTWDYVRDRLITEYERIRPSEEISDDVRIHDALYTGSMNKAPSRQFKEYETYRNEREESSRKCHYCKETGHVIKDCEKKLKADERKRFREEESAAYCWQGEAEEFEPEIALQVDTEGGNEKSWYLDSGCSRHMTSVENDFTDLKPIDPIPVILPNKSTIYAIGSGTVKIKITDVKGNNVVIAFQNVLYVPELRKMLISNPQMTSGGAEIIFKKDICVLIGWGTKK